MNNIRPKIIHFLVALLICLSVPAQCMKAGSDGSDIVAAGASSAPRRSSVPRPVLSYADHRDSDDSTGSSGSNYSDDLFTHTFETFLKEQGALDKYKAHKDEDTSWRGRLRDEYLEEMSARVMGDCYNRDNSLTVQIIGASVGPTRLKILTILSLIADNAILAYSDEAEPSIIGTYRHTFCEKYLAQINTAGYLSFLALEKSFKNKNIVPKGTAGSVRPDVYWQDEGIAFDYKFGGASVKDSDIAAWTEHLPNYHGYEEIKKE